MNHQHLVVHCKHDAYDVYIGRASKSAPKGVPCDWGNPFAMKKQSNDERSRVCAAYEKWITAQPSLVAKAKKELKGKVLGCYCSPKDCHGHILARIANEDTSETDCGAKSFKKSLPSTTTPNQITPVAAPACPVNSDHQQVPRKESLKSGAHRPQTEVDEALLLRAPPASSPSCLVDIGINVHNKQMLKTWRQQVQRAYDAKVTTIILTGTSIKCSSNSLDLAETYMREKSPDMDMALYCTVGIHPHDAKSFQGSDTLHSLRSLLQHPLAVAVGECGLDYNRNFSTPTQQKKLF